MKTDSARLLAVGLTLATVLSTVGHGGGPAAAPNDGIGVCTGNPYYWQYHGRPVLLLGGSCGPAGALGFSDNANLLVYFFVGKRLRFETRPDAGQQTAESRFPFFVG